MGNRRFKNRKLSLFDIGDRFERESAQKHMHTARAAIERLRSDGREVLDDQTDQLSRWYHYCNVLLDFMNNLSRFYSIENQPLTTVLRRFIAEYEHSSHRIFRLLYGKRNAENEQLLQGIVDWMDVVYRYSTYAIIAYWIDEKHDDYAIHTDITMDHDDENKPVLRTRTTYSHTPMPKPKDKMHRRGMKPL